MSLVFYDTETTGTDRQFDQILQFAGFKVSEDLQVIEKFESRCRLKPHIVPSPGALIVTGLDPEDLVDPQLPSYYEMAIAVKSQIEKWSPSIFIGHNSLDFDEILIRHMFYKNLMHPYATNSGGNSRADTLNICHGANVFAPGILKVPIGDKGKPTFKLDQLAPLNGMTAHNAHDAMGDVEAALFISQKVKKEAGVFWNAIIRSADKAHVLDFAKKSPLFVLTGVYFGKAYNYVVVYAGANEDDANGIGIFDLKFNPKDYIDKSVDELVKVMNSSRKAVRSFRANAHPILMEFDAEMCRAFLPSVTEAEARKRADIISSNLEFQKRVGEALSRRYEDKEPEPTAFVDQRLYEGFTSPADSALMSEFHHEDWVKRPSIAERFEDVRHRELALRLIHMERPDVLSAAQRAEWDAWRAQRLRSNDPNVPWMTIPKALAEADALLASATPEEAKQIRRIRRFIETR